ncbi:MAG: HipA domain-containing protein [Buchananella hordeovulneris]|nr:HipA domain-containing protein [Buchananella hordeovulneris]
MKLTPRAYPHLVENEMAHLQAAANLGLAVVKAQLVSDAAGESGLFVERFDRVCPGGHVRRLAFEDATQLLDLMPATKYDVPTETVLTTLAARASAPLVTAQKALTHFIFAWASGNGDLHAKNIALLGRPAREGEFDLAPMYDVPCTLIYGDAEMALSIGGRKKNLKAKHWRELAAEVGIPERALAGIAGVVLSAASAVDWDSLPFEGSVRNGCLRELRARRYELEQLAGDRAAGISNAAGTGRRPKNG